MGKLSDTGSNRIAVGKLIVVLVVLASLSFASTAAASAITVGSSLTGSFTTSSCGSPCTLLNSTVAGSNPVVSPVNGVIVRWRIIGGTSIPGYAIRVLRPSGSTYTAVGSSSPQTPAGTGSEVFSSAVPIQAGDAIGIDTPAGAALPIATTAAGAYLGWLPPLNEGEAKPFIGPAPGKELGYNADVQPQPTVAGVIPASGSFRGGTGVTILGTDFAGVKAVSFGSIPATSFGVTSEGQITAIAPRAVGPGAVEVSVTTIAGKSVVNPPRVFTYTACVVPKLRNKSLKAARKALKKGGCKLGTVKRPKGLGAAAKVVKQGAKPGTDLAPKSKVNVKLG